MYDRDTGAGCRSNNDNNNNAKKKLALQLNLFQHAHRHTNLRCLTIETPPASPFPTHTCYQNLGINTAFSQSEWCVHSCTSVWVLQWPVCLKNSIRFLTATEAPTTSLSLSFLPFFICSLFSLQMPHVPGCFYFFFFFSHSVTRLWKYHL